VNGRKLTPEEILTLVSRGCTCSDWNEIAVAEKFNPEKLHDVLLSGKIRLGIFEKTLELPGGITVNSGLSDCRIHNCTIDDDAYIFNVKSLANYHIEKNAVVENVESLIVEGESAFGNGVELDIVNEGGGRTLKIFDNLSANLACFMVFYRHNKKFISGLENIISDYVKGKKSNIGSVKESAKILNCGAVINVNVGAYAVISGASNLKDGTIVSCKEDPAFVGNDVIAKNFIILSGAKVDDAVIIQNSFVGQSVKMGKQYSAENSAFFANSEAFHGEACSIFGGPYTVTHHKSSLLIAGYYSFYNAGSGTNQSNHMYKLGPIHQGIVERGSKTGSFCYLLWPCRIGPFTTVLGKHYSNFDTSNLPFSYINEEDGKSFITPAMNMFTVGTRRDSRKWQARDRRLDPVKLDLINYNLFNPLIVGKMNSAITELNELYEKTPKDKETINYKGINLRRLLLKASRKYYEMGIKIFIGNSVVKKLEHLNENSLSSHVKNLLQADTSNGLEKWLDIAGLLTPESWVNLFVKNIEEGKIKSIEEIHSSLKEMQRNYDTNEWNWCAALIEQKYNIKIEEITNAILKEIIEDWKTNLTRLNNMIIQDATKEFDSFAKIGYGIDGDDEVKNSDFESIHGTIEGNSFISEIKKESEEAGNKADKLLQRLASLV